MHAFEYILIMLVAVLVSSLVGARFPRLSTPLVQIALGVLFAILPISFEMHLEPELFMVLFIAPLLFNDASKMDKPALWRLKFPILWLALGLVFLTVLVLGFAVNLFAPSIPLAAAFALAAALAPTDAVSVDSLMKNASISKEQSKLLRGESLLNDASSIVSFNFAVAAAITGTFSIFQAEGTFVVMFIGGLVLGVVAMLARYALLHFIRARGIDNTSFHVLFEIVTPFLVYLLAELIGVSGIIAVVAAGIAHSFAPRIVTPSSARLNVVSTSVWSVISFTLNGLVFLILGTQLPYVARHVWDNTATNPNFLILFVVLIFLVIVALRFVWILVMHRNINLGRDNVELAYDESASMPLVDDDDEAELLSMNIGEVSAEERESMLEKQVAIERQQLREARSKRRKERRSARIKDKQAARSDKNYWKLHLFDALLLSLSGVKGAITLALILSIPLTLNGTEPFPARDLLIFLASGVIVLSLLLANIVVPLIAPKTKQGPRPASEVNSILDIYRQVIAKLCARYESGERAAVSEVVRQYYIRISALKANNSLELPGEPKVRRYVIDQQLENTQRLSDEDKINNLTALLYINSLSHLLARSEHHNTVLWELRAFIDQFSHRWRMRRSAPRGSSVRFTRDRHVRRYDLHALRLENYRYAIEKLSSEELPEDLPPRTVGLVRTELEQRLARLEDRWGLDGAAVARPGGGEKALLDVESRALELEREAINEAYAEGKLSGETAKMMRDNVALMELDIEDQLE